MINKKIKPYKSSSPSETINKIRNILSDLGIVVREDYTQNGQFHACRISMINDGLGIFNIGTNGKGLTVEYAFASAYAEFMERLQNNILLKKTIYSSTRFFPTDSTSKFHQKHLENGGVLDYVYDPDEKYVSSIDIVNSQLHLLTELFLVDSKPAIENAILNILKFEDLICVPFYDKTANQTDYLPIELILHTCGSNGMCAGNTPEEALIQGICEIFERYVGREIYKNELTPPTIPHEYFIDFPVFESIKRLETNGLSITIKDLSLGKGLPVIGVLVVDKNKNTYNVKIGSDPWPVTALERCLTELHQSSDGIRLIEKKGFGYYLDKEFLGIDKQQAKYVNMRKIFTNSTGQWPDSIFSEDFSYEFKELNFNHAISDHEDLEYLCSIIEKLDKKLYIRDTSYLGFNSYYIVIPGLSQGKISHEDNFVFFDFYTVANFLNRLEALNDAQLLELVISLEKNKKLFEIHGINFTDEFNPNDSPDLNDLNVDLFLCMCNYKLKNYSQALIHMDYFLKDKESESHLYFFACKDYIYFKREKYQSDKIINLLMKLYEYDLVEEVHQDMKDTNKILDNYNFPNCFNCDTCKAINNCMYFNNIQVAKRIQAKQIQSKICQSKLSSVFHQTEVVV